MVYSLRMVISQPQNYKIIIERDEDGYYVASVPCLPGCVTQAPSLAELEGRVREAIELCLEVADEDPDYREKIERFSYEPGFIGVDTIEV